MYGGAPPTGLPVVRSIAFATTHCHFASAIRWSSRSAPKSNSWLPSVAMSSPAALSAAIICSPLKIVDATDEERKSPASSISVVRAVAGQPLLEGRDAGESAGAIHRHGGVDVVDLQDGERRADARRARVVGLLRRGR